MPRVTVITPTYNRAGLLGETIQSVLAQTMPDFEYLIIDDGSADDTKAVAEAYLSDPRVHYYYQNNAGEPAAANYGWSLAQGEYFVQVNSDDPALPNLLEEMCLAMDAHPEAVVGYCDFQFIDDHGTVLSVTESPDWDFLTRLKSYSCTAASPGTFFRRSAFSDWKTIRCNHFKHINDVEMLWNMALVGDFLHVPKVLATWRQHAGQISNERYRSIPEIMQWYQAYFAQENLPASVLDCKEACKESIIAYFLSLIVESNLSETEKVNERVKVRTFQLKREYRYLNLQVGDNDLFGNKFNGHNLHLLLREKGIRSLHFVTNKASNDADTIVIDCEAKQEPAQWLLHRCEFALSDIVHLHLIHNMGFAIQLLPVMTKLKPVVITLHDPFFFGGHCIHHFDCEKWKTHCYDCEHLDIPFVIDQDDTALSFFEKKTAFQNADISVIVASKWMEDKVRCSPVFAGKPVYRIPFGIDQEVFKPIAQDEAREALTIPKDDFVIMFRSDRSPFKGLDLIREALANIRSEQHITLLLVGQQNLLTDMKDRFTIRDFGWLTDDEQLAKLYQACDVFLMPSKMEAFGMMAIEAMSCGKTVLAITGTSLPDVIHAPDCGIAVEKERYTDALQELIDHPELRRLHGDASLEYARQQYNQDVYIERMLDVYDDVMKRHKPDAAAALVLEQIARSFERNEMHRNASKLCKSVSWRITRPFRAIMYAFHGKEASLRASIHNIVYYMQDSVIDNVPNQVILQSWCWRITGPLRKVANVLRRIGKEK